MQVATTATGPQKASEHRSGRLRGLDLARALALLGMLIVNYELVVSSPGSGPEWLRSLTESLQGRAAATFVVLAGIGASLGARRANLALDAAPRRAARARLARRALWLLAGGLAFLVLWPADILHFYGAWMLVGAGLLFAPGGAIAAAMLTCVAVNAVFLLRGSFFANWNLFDLSYRGLWSPDGFARNLFLDGWHPVFPWLALYLFGMLVGRLDLRARRTRSILGGCALLVFLTVHGIERLWGPTTGWTGGPRQLLSTASFPPTPAFIEAGAASALLVICAAFELCRRLPPTLLWPLEAVGQLALTLYVAHVVVGLGVLESIGRMEHQSLPFSVGSALAFFAGAAVFAVLWRRHFRRGPLEQLLRSLSG